MPERPQTVTRRQPTSSASSITTASARTGKFRMEANTGSNTVVFASLSLTGTAVLPAGGTLRLLCDIPANVDLTTRRMTAVRVGSVTVRP